MNSECFCQKEFLGYVFILKNAIIYCVFTYKKKKKIYVKRNRRLGLVSWKIYFITILRLEVNYLTSTTVTETLEIM